MANIHFAADHAGLKLKTSLIMHLTSLGHNIIDHGTKSGESCDYPVFAIKACEALLDNGDFAILICGTGIGMSIVANKTKGIRAALCTCEFHARASRKHNNANVLCIGERITGIGLAYAIADTFLSTAFEEGRHQKRLDYID